MKTTKAMFIDSIQYPTKSGKIVRQLSFAVPDEFHPDFYKACTCVLDEDTYIELISMNLAQGDLFSGVFSQLNFSYKLEAIL